MNAFVRKEKRNTRHLAWEFQQFIFHQLAPNDEYVCMTKKGSNGSWHNWLRESNVFNRWTRVDDAAAWYFSLSTTGWDLNAKGTMVGRGRDNLVRYHALMLDDIGDGEGSKANEPPVSPACKLETSAGNYQWIYRVKAGNDFAVYAALVELAIEKGWCDPGAVGEYRVARLPRSANHKPGRNGFRTKVEYVDTETVWGLLELAEALGLDRAEVAARAAQNANKGTSKGVATSTVTTISGETLDPVLAWLNTAGYVRDEPDAKGFVSIVCPWHDQHTTGEDTASYSPLGLGGSYAANRGFNCFHAHCKGRVAEDFLEWVKGQGGPKATLYDPLPVIQANYVFVERGPQVLDLRERRAGREPLRDMNEFGTANFGKIEVAWSKNKVTIKNAFISSHDTTRCKGLTYAPTIEDAPLKTAPDGALLANMYQPPQWPETDTEPTVFIEHVEYLLPDPREQEYFQGWLAHKIQNPSERGVGIVMIAEDTYGVGRSWLGKLLDVMLPNEVQRTDIKQLAGGNGGGAAMYNDLCANKQFVIVDETQADDPRIQYKAYENFKLVVDTSPTKLRINPKYGKVYDAELLFNLLAFSNNLDALHIPPGDRRFCILSNPTTPRDQAYYTRLYGSLDDAGFLAAVYCYLRRYDWSAINPRKPLQTKAREAMIEATKSPSEQITEAILDDNTMPDIMTRGMLKDRILKAVSIVSVDARQLDRIIPHIEKRLWVKMHDAPWKDGDDDKRFRPRIGGKVTHVKAWRDGVVWPDEGADWEVLLSQNLMQVWEG
jgi:hypothetical protein